jgi:hypothetical protein
MTRLKVLKHTCYLYSKHRDAKLVHELDTYHEEITPVYNRDGEYLLGDKCWFEVRGRAFTKRKEDFLFELQQLHMLDVDVQVVEHLDAIDRLSPNILSKKQRKLIREYNHFQWNRKNRRASLKRLHEMRKRFRKLKETI